MRRIAPLLVTAAAVALPAAASAAAIAPSAACYVDQGPSLGTQPITYTASGLAAGQTGTGVLSGAGLTSAATPFGPADPAGNGAGQVTWGDQFGNTPTSDVPGTLTLNDAAGAPIASAPVMLANAALGFGGVVSKDPSKKANWEVTGLGVLTGKTVYTAFYIKQSEAKKKHPKVFAKQKLGKGTGPCVHLVVKKPLSPFRTSGKYVIAVQTNTKFDAKGLGVLGVLSIKKTRK